jgi:GWxTD domain-containing protein
MEVKVNKIVIFIFLFFTAVILFSCSSNQRISNQNVAFIYKKEAPAFNPEFTILHLSDTLSELHFRIPSNQVLYSRPSPDEPFSANIKVAYRIFDDFDAHLVFDTGSVVLHDIANADILRDLISNIKFRAYKGYNYVLEITVSDLNKNRSKKSFVFIEKSNINNRQNFFLKDPNSQLPLFRNIVKENYPVQINFINPNKEKLIVRYYNRDFNIAAPPFAMINPRPFDYKSDSLFEINLENASALLEFSKKGFYHIQSDTTLNRDGITLYYFNNNFPEIKSVDDMIAPLRYITSKQEYEEITSSINKKEAVDKFWLNIAGNPDRARELISIFYNRVKEANIHFTSYIEGWKTDRGMIYIIFGPPNVLYKTTDRESWIFGEDHNMMSLNFNFFKVDNPFTDNDYGLDRSVIYKTNWYRAVDTWRQARVY